VPRLIPKKRSRFLGASRATQLKSALVVVALFCLSAVPRPARAQDVVTVPFTAGIGTPERFKAAIDGRVSRARELLNGLLTVTGPRTAANTLAPYDDMWGELFTARSQASVITSNHPDERMRKLGEELNRGVSALAAEIPLRPDVYAALQAIDLRGADAPTRYYVERELRDFRLAGVDKPAATRQRIQQLRDELTQVMDEFGRNIRNERGRVVVKSVAELAGLPDDFVARHKPAAGGAITLATDAVDARPVLTYAKSADLRRRMLLETYNVAPQNLEVLARMLRVRSELATLLGFPNWAAFDMASRMAGTVDAASRFIDRVVEASGPSAAREYGELVKRKQQDEPGSAFNLWDRPYYAELVRKSSYDFDSQAVRPYFPFAQVLQGVLDVTGRIFGLTYTPVGGIDVWHPSVRVFEMRAGGRLVGRVYLDLHPRPNKAASGANVNTVRYGQAGRSMPEAVLTASLPGGQPGDPGLMTHDEVRTLFHEFGHVVHRLSGGHQPWQRLSSVSMERDFGEAPSQMLEEWIWDPKTLATFARHYQTGEPIPAPLVRQMRRASDFGQALEVRGQMVLARAALSYHDRDPKSLDTTGLWKEIHDRYMPLQFPENSHRQATFPHLGNAGYASAYYTDMWSLVIAKDMFSTFDGADLISPGVAARYRETVFAPGSSKPAADLVRDFLGRSFTFDAWERWLNGQAAAGSR
jgi:thimet oligopeptidase